MEQLIFDRNKNDLINETYKANYNYTDLNRVEEWCEYISDRLNEYNYFVDISVKTNWTMLDFPTISEMERIRSNINKLKIAYYSFTNVPENLNKMDIDKANVIEKILSEIDILIKNMIASFRPCGTFTSGGMEGLI